MTIASITQPTPTPTPPGFEPLSFAFTKWDGPPPGLVRQHVEPFSLAGVDGIGARLTGIYGEAFTVGTESVFALFGDLDRTVTTAELASGRVRELIGEICFVAWEGLSYDTAYKTRYLVENVVPVRVKRNVRLIGQTFDYSLGSILSANWTLRPIYVGSGNPLSHIQA